MTHEQDTSKNTQLIQELIEGFGVELITHIVKTEISKVKDVLQGAGVNTAFDDKVRVALVYIDKLLTLFKDLDEDELVPQELLEVEKDLSEVQNLLQTLRKKSHREHSEVVAVLDKVTELQKL